jgi:ketosteroid isomerase-like protein
MAFSRGTYTLSLTPKEGGPTTHIDGKWLDILKRQTDGSWKIYIDMVNYNGPPVVE